MTAQPKTRLTPEEYLAIERAAEYKSEFYNGEMFAMSGASRNHVRIVRNLVGELRAQLKRRPCDVYSTDLRLRVDETGLYTYPDVMVACAEQKFADDHHDTLLNPILVIEVLSESTKNYDRGEKFTHYRRIGSLQEYLLVAQDRAHIELHVRQAGNGWLLTEFDGREAVIRLAAISCVLEAAEIYDKIEFEEEKEKTFY